MLYQVSKPLLSRALVSCFPPSLSDSRRIVPLSNVFPSIVGHIPRWNLDRPFLTGRFHQEQLVWELMRRIFLRIRSEVGIQISSGKICWEYGRCSKQKFVLEVLSQRLGLGKGGLRMAPEEAVGELLQGSLNKANIEEWK
ncbi:hypothetical protein V6N12_009301 [Hibiscus sabdariffa]|uniref:Uncharacterized protein n=1 Tax=Hibiscus sabdariffa TaxID=183260 RepID=A0ABR2AV66_9ROSI